MLRFLRTILIASAFLLTLAYLADTAWACPTCKDGMANDPATSNMVNGYFWSILFMMSMPFLVFSGLAAYFYFEIRRARARQAVAAAAERAESRSDTATSPEIALLS